MPPSPSAAIRHSRAGIRCFCLLHTSLLPQLTHYLQAGERKMDRWFANVPAAEVCFPDEQAFCNINTLQELHQLESDTQ